MCIFETCPAFKISSKLLNNWMFPLRSLQSGATGLVLSNRFPETQLELTSRGVPRPFWWQLGTRLSPAVWGSCWGWRPASPPGSPRWTRTLKPARGCTPSRASYPAATASHRSSSAETNSSKVILNRYGILWLYYCGVFVRSLICGSGSIKGHSTDFTL